VPAPSTTALRRTICIVLAATLASPAFAQAAPPDNDDFADGQVVRVGDHLTGTLVDATRETGEPATSYPSVDHTVWYRLTPTTSERLRIDTCGSDRWAELAVFTGGDVAALTEIARNEVDCAGGARVYLDAEAGTTYHVRVAGYDWGTSIGLTVERPQVPANDDFAAAQALDLPADVDGTTVDATAQPGEPEPGPYSSGHSVWYRFTATTADVVTIRLRDCGDASGSGSQLAAYAGESLATLKEVGDISPVCGRRSFVTLFPQAGTTYRIAVRGAATTSERFRLRVATVPAPAGPVVAPPNPKCPFELAEPGSITYRGTHSGGGEVCLTVAPSFAGVAWFNLVNPPRDLCIPFAVEHYQPALPIVGRRFTATTSSAQVTGTFGGQQAHGTFKAAIPPGGESLCSGRVITWAASTQATPPPAISDETGPTLRVRGATTQHPLRSGRLVVRVHCPVEACTAIISARVAGVYLKAAPRRLPARGAASLALRLSPAARRAARRALRSRRSFRTRVTAVALDGVGNLTTKRRTLTLRR